MKIFGWVDKGMNERLNESTIGWINEQVIESMNKWLIERMGEWTSEFINQWMIPQFLTNVLEGGGGGNKIFGQP